MSSTIEDGWATIVGERIYELEHELPLLARFWADRKPAHSVKIEWLVDTDQGRVAWHNYTQIIRHQAGYTTTASSKGEGEKRKKLVEHLRALETILWFGKREWVDDTVAPRGFCGGVLEFLGREPTDGDHITLRFLQGRNPKLRALDHDRFEWISEMSVEVAPARTIRRPRSLAAIA